MYYVTSAYSFTNSDVINELWYREFEDINKAYDFRLVLKMYGWLISNYRYVNIRNGLYSNEYGFFNKRMNDDYLKHIVREVYSRYKS